MNRSARIALGVAVCPYVLVSDILPGTGKALVCWETATAIDYQTWSLTSPVARDQGRRIP